MEAMRPSTFYRSSTGVLKGQTWKRDGIEVTTFSGQLLPTDSLYLANRRTTPVICTTFDSPDILVARTLRDRSSSYALNEEHCFIHLSTLVAAYPCFGSRYCRLERAGIRVPGIEESPRRAKAAKGTPGTCRQNCDLRKSGPPAISNWRCGCERTRFGCATSEATRIGDHCAQSSADRAESAEGPCSRILEAQQRSTKLVRDLAISSCRCGMQSKAAFLICDFRRCLVAPVPMAKRAIILRYPSMHCKWRSSTLRHQHGQCDPMVG
jgi:hypothetical protein